MGSTQTKSPVKEESGHRVSPLTRKLLRVDTYLLREREREKSLFSNGVALGITTTL